jgi:membrane protein implicated in regulation of membrane protease activity
MEWAHTVWFWWGLALALFAGEALLPGAFMLWLGFAAAATGFVVLAVPLEPSSQWVAFGVLGLLSVFLGWRWRNRHPVTATDQPLLNRRAEQLVGRVLELHQAVVNGRGKLKIGDALWTVEADGDMPAGRRVKIAAVDGMLLRVVPCD